MTFYSSTALLNVDAAVNTALDDALEASLLNVAPEFDEQNPPPEGFQLTPPVRICPPGGFYYDFYVWVMHFGCNFSQVCMFFAHGDIMFGSLTLFSMIFYCLFLFSKQDSDNCNIVKLTWVSMRYSIARGESSDYFQTVLAAKTIVEGPAFGLVAPYGAMLRGQLSSFEGLISVGSLLLNMKSCANYHFRYECSGCTEYLSALAPRKAIMGLAWSFVRVSAEIACFAVSSAILHPMIVAPLLLAQSMVAQVFDKADPNKTWFDVVFHGIVNVFLPWGTTSTMLLPQPEGALANSPAHVLLVLTVARVLLLLLLALVLDLPHGFMNFGTLARPMGWFTPNTHCFSQRQSFLGDCFVCFPSDIQPVSNGSSLYRMVLMAFCFITGPIYIIGSVCLLACHGRYRRGEIDHDLLEDMFDKGEDIGQWCDQRALALGWTADPVIYSKK